MKIDYEPKKSHTQHFFQTAGPQQPWAKKASDSSQNELFQPSQPVESYKIQSTCGSGGLNGG